MVDNSAEFEPGQIGQLKLNGNQIVCGVSDGSAPFGIIDDIKKNAFSATSIDEEVIIPIPDVLTTTVGSNRKTIVDLKVELRHAQVSPSSFISRQIPVELIAENGVLVFLAGTTLNYDSDGDTIADALRTVVSYSYQVPNVPGDDSTMASGMVTIWFQSMLANTDQFEPNQTYPLNAPLFVSESGLLTTRQIDPSYPAVAMVTGPPGSMAGSLEFRWFG